ncbi:hypothetical protein BHM03_00024630 [Ensete ventricosum]|nr:hypothetical protein BHM03_00024630 [Ensete ventricosum]
MLRPRVGPTHTPTPYSRRSWRKTRKMALVFTCAVAPAIGYPTFSPTQPEWVGGGTPPPTALRTIATSAARPHEIPPNVEVARGGPAVHALGVRARGRGLLAPAIGRGDSAAEECTSPMGASKGSTPGKHSAATVQTTGTGNAATQEPRKYEGAAPRGKHNSGQAPTASGGAIEGTSSSTKRRGEERPVDLNLPPVSSTDTGDASSSSAGNSTPWLP